MNASLPPESLRDHRRVQTTVYWCIAVGILLRLALSSISIGTNDATTWLRIATLVHDKGLIGAYGSSDALNHPPLAVLWSLLSLKITNGTWFPFFMKLPAIMGDALSVVLIAKIWMAQQDFRRARWAAIAMALSPVAILVSGYHCNTDNLYASLVLLSIYLLTAHRRFFLGGLALAAAINVKLVPVLLIPPALSLCRSWREAFRLTGGLAIGVIPFLPLVLIAPEAVAKNMLIYNPPLSEWGVTALLHNIQSHPPFAQAVQTMVDVYYRWIGRNLILVSVTAVSVISWRTRRWNGYELATLCFAIFLVLAPGFGWQYTVIIVPLLLTISIPRSWVYGVLAGLYLLLGYWTRLVQPVNPWLLESIFIRDTPVPPGNLFGLLAWWTLAETAVHLLFCRSAKSPAASDPAFQPQA